MIGLGLGLAKAEEVHSRGITRTVGTGQVCMCIVRQDSKSSKLSRLNQVDDMTCSTCSGSVERALLRVPGVQARVEGLS